MTRGAKPAELVIKEYAHARPALYKRLGDYCSYCEVQAPNLTVEHIRCKSLNPTLEREWSNFLLACDSCNPTKGTKVKTEADVAARLWPHLHRTQDAFVYGPGGVVRVAPLADPVERAKAEATAEMVGLLKLPDNGLTSEQEMTASDRRWELRKWAWDEAVVAREDLWSAPSEAMRKRIVSDAKGRGFFSVWLTVFRDDADMVDRLIRAFNGTDRARILTPTPTAPPPPPTPPPPHPA